MPRAPDRFATDADVVIAPHRLLRPTRGRKPKNWSTLDEYYDNVRRAAVPLFQELGLAA